MLRLAGNRWGRSRWAVAATALALIAATPAAAGAFTFDWSGLGDRSATRDPGESMDIRIASHGSPQTAMDEEGDAEAAALAIAIGGFPFTDVSTFRKVTDDVAIAHAGAKAGALGPDANVVVVTRANASFDDNEAEASGSAAASGGKAAFAKSNSTAVATEGGAAASTESSAVGLGENAKAESDADASATCGNGVVQSSASAHASASSESSSGKAETETSSNVAVKCEGGAILIGGTSSASSRAS